MNLRGLEFHCRPRKTRSRRNSRGKHGRSLQVGRHAVRQDGVLGRRLRAQGHRRHRAVPHHAAGRRRCDRSRRGSRGRIVDRDMDRRVDRPPDRVRALSRQGLSRRSGAQHRPGDQDRAAVLRVHRLRPRPLRAGLHRQPDGVDHRQRVRLQGDQGAAAGRHAHPGGLSQDLPGTGHRHRRRARAAGQVRPSAAGRHHQAQARAVRRATTGASSTRR